MHPMGARPPAPGPPGGPASQQRPPPFQQQPPSMSQQPPQIQQRPPMPGQGPSGAPGMPPQPSQPLKQEQKPQIDTYKATSNIHPDRLAMVGRSW